MKLQYLCLFPLVFQVLGNSLAGPAQMLFLWYAYRLDIKVFGYENILLAPECAGTVSDGSCYFDEFLRYIQRVGERITPWRGTTSVGKNLNPAVLDTIDELSKSGYQATTDARTLLPYTFGDLGTDADPSFSTVYGQIVDNIQACRRKVNDVGLEEELDDIRRATVSMVDAREHDQAQFVIDEINTKLAKNGYTWKVNTKNVVGPDLNKWSEIDTKATIEAHSATADASVLSETITKYISDVKSDSSYGRHQRAIIASQNLQSRLLGDASC